MLKHLLHLVLVPKKQYASIFSMGALYFSHNGLDNGGSVYVTSGAGAIGSSAAKKTIGFVYDQNLSNGRGKDALGVLLGLAHYTPDEVRGIFHHHWNLIRSGYSRDKYR